MHWVPEETSFEYYSSRSSHLKGHKSTLYEESFMYLSIILLNFFFLLIIWSNELLWNFSKNKQNLVRKFKSLQQTCLDLIKYEKGCNNSKGARVYLK